MGGDRAAMESLWQEHRRWIAAVLLAYKPAQADLEDLLQEVAMTLVAKINTLREESNLRAWLRAIAVNVARGAARQPERGVTLSTVDASDRWQSQDIEGPFTDEAQRVLGVAADLPDIYREPLMLRAVHGLRTRQIAEILDIEEAAVDTRISRARRMLREALSARARGPTSAHHRSTAVTSGNGQVISKRLEVQP